MLLQHVSTAYLIFESPIALMLLVHTSSFAFLYHASHHHPRITSWCWTLCPGLYHDRHQNLLNFHPLSLALHLYSASLYHSLRPVSAVVLPLVCGPRAWTWVSFPLIPPPPPPTNDYWKWLLQNFALMMSLKITYPGHRNGMRNQISLISFSARSEAAL